jgi:ribosomal protein L20A (L18A)
MVTKKEKKLSAFTVEGKLLLKEGEKSFSKDVLAYNSANAAERTLTLFGSKNKIKRKNIQINEAKEKK